MRKIFAVAAATALTFAMSTTAFAAWKQDKTGQWRYSDERQHLAHEPGHAGRLQGGCERLLGTASRAPRRHSRRAAM